MNEGFRPSELNQQDTERLRGYDELLNFYRGQHWEGHPRWGETRLTFNYAKVIIDKLTSYLMSGINFAVDPVADTPEARTRAQRAEQALYRVYEANNLEQLDFETEIDCAIYYGTLHTIDAGGSTLPGEYHDLVVTGASGYAAISWAAYAINKVNIGGRMSAEEYRT